ncbi:MAG: lipopolysaccharide biosynthesis protein [Chlamydiota bacterium]
MKPDSPGQAATAIPPHVGRVRASFSGDVLQLATGTASSQVIGILAAPLIARMFAPPAFGVLAIFSAAAGLIAVASCLRYEVTIYLPERDEEAINIVALCLGLVAIITGLTAGLVYVAGGHALQLAHVPELAGYIWLLPLNVLVSGVWMVLNCWNQRKRRFGRITVLQVVMRIAMVGSQIILGLAGFVSGGALVATTIFGTLVPSVLLGWQTLRDDGGLLLHGVSWTTMGDVLRRYHRFPRFGLAAILLNTTSFQLPAILLSSFFNMGVVGNYSFGFRVLRVPGTLIGTNVARAFFPRAAEARHQGTLGGSVELALQYLITLSFFPCFLLAMTGGTLFTFVFGARWHEAGVYAQIMSVWLFFWFVSSPLNTVFAVLEEQALELRFQTANLVTRLGALVVGGVAGNARLAIALFALCGVAVYGGYCLAVIRKSGASGRAVGRVTLTRAALFVPAAALILGLRAFSAPPVGVAAAVAIILAVYYWNVARTDANVRAVLKRFLRRPFYASDAAAS